METLLDVIAQSIHLEYTAIAHGQSPVQSLANELNSRPLQSGCGGMRRQGFELHVAQLKFMASDPKLILTAVNARSQVQTRSYRVWRTVWIF